MKDFWDILNKKKEEQKRQAEEMTTAASAGIPADTKNMGPRDMWDKRRKKDTPPVLKRFKSFSGM